MLDKTPFDKTMLYNTRALYGPECRVCFRKDYDGHAAGCPVPLLERMYVSINVRPMDPDDGDDSNRDFTGPTVEAATADAADYAADNREPMVCFVTYMVDPAIPGLDDAVTLAVGTRAKALAAQRKAEETARKQAAAVQARVDYLNAALAKLEGERADLVPAAYERRKADIIAAHTRMFGPPPTPVGAPTA